MRGKCNLDRQRQSADQTAVQTHSQAGTAAWGDAETNAIAEPSATAAIDRQGADSPSSNFVGGNVKQRMTAAEIRQLLGDHYAS